MFRQPSVVGCSATWDDDILVALKCNADNHFLCTLRQSGHYEQAEQAVCSRLPRVIRRWKSRAFLHSVSLLHDTHTHTHTHIVVVQRISHKPV